MKKIIALYKTCRRSGSNFLIVVLRFSYYGVLYKKRLLLHHRAKIRGVNNIVTSKPLSIGLQFVGFLLPSDKSFLNVRGRLEISGPYSIGRGCRFDIGPNAVVSIGNGGYINCNTTFVIMHGLKIGDGCVISWGCQFLDEDFHDISYESKTPVDSPIALGNHVWIGCGCKIYKGVTIPDGCVIAADTVLKKSFDVTNALIAGNPARIIKENISWK